MEIQSVVPEDVSPCSSILTVVVAVNGSRNSKLAVKWALERFIPEGIVLFKILHIRPKITSVPTPMGNSIPISSVRDEVVSAYRKEIEWQTNSMLLPFKQMCTRRRVEAEAVAIEADDVVAAISDEISKFSITTLVIGASSHNVFTRKLRGQRMASRISGCIPTFCTLYVISKGKLCSVRPSTSDVSDSNNDERHDRSNSSGSETSCTVSTQTEGSETSTSTNGSFVQSSSLPMQRYQALLAVNHAIINRKSKPIDPQHHRHLSLLYEVDATSSDANCSELQYDESLSSSFSSTRTDNQSCYSGQASTSDTPTDSSLERNKINLDVELEKLRIELRHVRGMYAMAKNETAEASQQLDELSGRQMEEKMRLWEVTLREQKARELARQEMERTEAAKWEADFVKECAEREALQRKEAEIKAARDTQEKQKLERSLICIDQKYKKFSWEEIVSSTSSFSDSLKIGTGAYGLVYKCNLGHATAAVKVLHSTMGHKSKQFQQELEVLSRIRHPHLLMLLGACPGHGCLVYEYMENGSLEDRLLRKNNTLPIPWYHRFRIAWEVASALAFLHNSKPKPVVHRDLKPSNILLDGNFVSKIGDVGLSTLLPTEDDPLSTVFKDTAPVGTLCYIDPEYQRSGLVSPKSDLYAYGIVILQLLTAKSPMGLAHVVENALEERNLAHLLDSEAGSWPSEQAQELAVLGLRCTELRRRDRPDLETQVLPVLERLKKLAEKDVMNDLCVAADGYTYDRDLIEHE
ncbi:U-box domain-containing protein 35-like isoform X2 [Aristolochia californica]|uniref:U-box domain-containing protein 35-like isoform X2 n=1 Tax=Aristolochia californica TaxID=171875 RepID=UPI0035D57629